MVKLFSEFKEHNINIDSRCASFSNRQWFRHYYDYIINEEPSVVKRAHELGFKSPVISKSISAEYSKKPFKYLWYAELRLWLANKKIYVAVVPTVDTNKNRCFTGSAVNIKTGETRTSAKITSYEELLEVLTIIALDLLP